MNRSMQGSTRWATAALLLLSVAGCGSDAGLEATGQEGPARLPPKPMVDQGYGGPPLEARLEQTSGDDVILQVQVDAPTGGYDLQHDDTVEQGEITKVRLTLTEPGPKEMVTQAMETLKQRVRLQNPSGHVQVLVRRKQRNVDTGPPAEYRLAAEIRAP